MNHYSHSSRARLDTCHPFLIRVFEGILLTIDHTIISGHRGQIEQDDLFLLGKTEVRFPDSKHNSDPSHAVDAAPCPIDWKDRERATLFAGFVIGYANSMDVRLRWGGDWNGNWHVKDNLFDDLWHFELLENASSAGF